MAERRLREYFCFLNVWPRLVLQYTQYWQYSYASEAHGVFLGIVWCNLHLWKKSKHRVKLSEYVTGTYMQHIWIKLEPWPFCTLLSMPLGHRYAPTHAPGSLTDDILPARYSCYISTIHIALYTQSPTNRTVWYANTLILHSFPYYWMPQEHIIWM